MAGPRKRYTAECVMCSWRFEDTLDWLVWHEGRTHAATHNIGIFRSGSYLPAPDANDQLSFDECEQAGVDGTGRTT